VLKWHCQPEARSRNWAASIRSTRAEIRDIQEETPSLNDDVIRELWQKCFQTARDEAEAEMNQEVSIPHLTWDDVFTAEYRI
jgi:hypothetical protein